jgi:hypothetical protein
MSLGNKKFHGLGSGASTVQTESLEANIAMYITVKRIKSLSINTFDVSKKKSVFTKKYNTI